MILAVEMSYYGSSGKNTLSGKIGNVAPRGKSGRSGNIASSGKSSSALCSNYAFTRSTDGLVCVKVTQLYEATADPTCVANVVAAYTVDVT